MNLKQSYEINRPRIVCENMDGEVVAMDMNQGTYFSLQHAAAQLWEMIEAGWSPEACISSLTENHGSASAQIREDIPAFFETCIKEELIRPLKEESPPKDLKKITPAESDYVSPLVTRYDDMQDLLMVDPIHDSGEEGWPAVKEDPKPE